MLYFIRSFWFSFTELGLMFLHNFRKMFWRLPMLFAAVIVFMVLWNAFVFVATALLSDIVPAIPSTALLVWGWFMPSNVSTLFITMYSVRLARLGFDIKYELLKLKVR